ncbi:carbohydrate ABC transporter permease [Saccharibacillus endophyticus]|uniref:ABC transporter permease n=1 Tax=Saccharibacillus endophyticus TaxID=2060666 RepID=A0ABQ1ZM89_9BACL|nr:sugar ABC transporter permease [Saccharibacillus endophyticus]GGH70270.1 ABC transporter permease [Saccharibacillus endophyticus]
MSEIVVKESIRGKKKRLGKMTSQGWVWFIFLLPTLLGIGLFTLYPMLESFRLSFTRGAEERYVGLENYRYVLTSGSFRQAIFNTFYIAFFQLLIVIPSGFIIACLIQSLRRGKNFFKILFYIPNITSMVAAATVFLVVLHPQGLLNYALSFFGIPETIWLANPTSARWSVILLASWHTLGFGIIINLANLQAISPDYYEAASIDGASRFKQWLYITVPNMLGSITILVILGWIDGLQRFTEAFMLGGHTGSPVRSLYTLVGFIYERGFGGLEYGVASAASYLLLVLILIFTFINIKFFRMKI